MQIPGFPLPSYAPIEPSSGPQRSQRSAREGEGGGKNKDKGKGRERPHSPPDAPPVVDTDWNQTLERFQEVVQNVHKERTTGGLTPESAVAEIQTFVKEDLHQSVSVLFYCD